MVDIEEIEVGDNVWAKDTETGAEGWKEVIDLFTNIEKPIYQINLLAEDGEHQVIESTDDHPFYVIGKEWVDTMDLVKGDLIETKTGEPVIVESVELAGRNEVTYNFTVEDYHTYYVTEYGVLVHNCGGLIQGRNFKDHFIRKKHLLENVTGNKYPKLKTHGQSFLDDINSLIDDGTFVSVGQGTLKLGQPALNIYRGNGLTVAIKNNGEFVTLLKSGEGMDLAIKMVK